GDGDQGGKPAGAALADQQGRLAPLAVQPAQAARLAGSAGGEEEGLLELGASGDELGASLLRQSGGALADEPHQHEEGRRGGAQGEPEHGGYGSRFRQGGPPGLAGGSPGLVATGERVEQLAQVALPLLVEVFLRLELDAVVPFDG